MIYKSIALLAGDPKYAKWKNASKKTKVELLITDDKEHFLSAGQRIYLLSVVEKQYKNAKKKKLTPEETVTELLAQFAISPKKTILSAIVKLVVADEKVA